MQNLGEFIPAFGNRPAHLVGRSEIIERFMQGLSAPPGHPSRATLLIGQRGMGKTTLLLEFAEHAEREGFVVARALANENVLEDLIGGVQRKGEKFLPKKRSVTGAQMGILGFSAGLNFTAEVEQSYSFLNKLVLLSEALAQHNRGIVFEIDEVQANSPEMRIVASAYQHLVGEGHNVVIVMAGLPHAISQVLNDEVLTFLNRARKDYLTPLAFNEVSTYYARAFGELKKTITPALLERAAVATKGYPYLLQLIGYYILEYSQNTQNITEDTLILAETSAKRELVDNIFAPVLKPLSKKDKAFLEAMAKDHGPSTVANISTRLKATKATVQAYRRRLLDAGIISAEQRGELEFIVPYLAEYLNGEF